MPRISTFLVFAMLILGLWACSPPNEPISTPTATPIPPTATITPSPLPPTDTPTPTPLGCLSQPGRLESGSLQETKPPQDFIIYLPHCYDEMPDLRYPVLYLLHGQTYTDDQWIRIGAVDAADKLILSGEAASFIIVFPDDRYWNTVAGSGFGDRLINNLIPYVDQHYRTLADRNHRALGGMSRGAGWTLHLGLTQWQLFGTLGLHSPAIFVDDRPFLKQLLTSVPPAAWPRIFMDSGDNDRELGNNLEFEALLTKYRVPHEWHLYSGAHDEKYWSAHVEEYIRWYAKGWNQ